VQFRIVVPVGCTAELVLPLLVDVADLLTVGDVIVVTEAAAVQAGESTATAHLIWRSDSAAGSFPAANGAGVTVTSLPVARAPSGSALLGSPSTPTPPSAIPGSTSAGAELRLAAGSGSYVFKVTRHRRQGQ
jgi:hypothetical protein